VSKNIKLDRFQKIIKSNKGILFKVISIYCKDPEDKKDLEQEILIQLWKALDNYNETYKISTWMYRIAMNVAIFFTEKHLDLLLMYPLILYLLKKNMLNKIMKLVIILIFLIDL
jgi:hypothetical protein